MDRQLRAVPRRPFRRSLTLSVATMWIMAGVLLAMPRPARADEPTRDLDHINLAYWGGRVLEHVKVVTLFWGPYWTAAPGAVNYFNGFFQSLFVDGRYMLNLQQYSAGGYRISNGQLFYTNIDPQAPPNPVTDVQIQAEIRARINAGALPAPDPDTVYFVFTPPNVVVQNFDGSVPGGFHGYNQDVPGSRFAYASIMFFIYTDPQGNRFISTLMTSICSHELAEAVTDPEVVPGGVAWWDLKNWEVGDIVVDLYEAGRIDITGFQDTFTASDGTRYVVQKMWSNWDKAPVAFATRSFFPTDGDAFSPDYLTPARKGRNLLQNGSFENGWQGWYGYSWRGTINASLVPDLTHEGQYGALVQNPLEDEISIGQPVTVKPNTRYLLSGWVRTRAVIPAQQGAKLGASLIIWYTYYRTQNLTGDNDWTYLAMIFNSGDQTQITVGPDLGYSNHATGTAWFDDICLIELP